METKQERVWPDVAVSPGEILAEELRERGMSQAEFARRTGRHVVEINSMVRGTRQITPKTAIQIERVLGIPAHIWVGLEKDYRYNKERLADIDRLTAESTLLGPYPVAEMTRIGWIKRSSNRTEQTRELLGFLGVSSLRNAGRSVGVSFRMSGRGNVNRQSLLCWLRKGQIEAQCLDTSAFDRELILAAIPGLRVLSRNVPGQFLSLLRGKCASCGIGVVVIPELRNIRVSGAVYWTGTRYALLLNLRYKSDDQFWFSFFHELGHIVFGRKRELYLDNLFAKSGIQDTDETEESRANRFAEDALIPRRLFEEFKYDRDFTETAIRRFAKEIGVAPGIVVGRLQHERLVPFGSRLNRLKVRYAWASS